jgi:hypothetical protein
MSQVTAKGKHTMQAKKTDKTPARVNYLTVDELKIIIEDAVDAKLEEYFGDPDEGLVVREEFLQKLSANRTSNLPILSMKEVKAKYDASEKTTRVKDLTLDQLKQLVDGIVEDKIEQIVGDPDRGLELRPEVVKELKESLAASRRGERGIPLEELAKEIGLDLK